MSEQVDQGLVSPIKILVFNNDHMVERAENGYRWIGAKVFQGLRNDLTDQHRFMKSEPRNQVIMKLLICGSGPTGFIGLEPRPRSLKRLYPLGPLPPSVLRDVSQQWRRFELQDGLS